MIWFLAGLLIGGTVGAVAMALLAMGGVDDGAE